MSGGRTKPAVLFPPPATPTLEVPRERVDGRCEACGGEALERYRLLRVTGWTEVVRCPACLEIQDETPAPVPTGFTYVPYGSYLRRDG